MSVQMQITTEADLLAYLNQAGDGWVADNGPHTWAIDRYELAVYTVAPCDPAQLEGLLRYIWAGPMRGEWWDGSVELLPGHCYIFDLDTTKSQRDDVPDSWDVYKRWLVEGTPVRLTNRAGPGTKGTRSYAGLGPVLLAWR